MPLECSLPFSTAEIDSRFAMVGGKHTKSVIRNLGSEPREDRIQSGLKVGKRHFAIDNKDPTRPGASHSKQSHRSQQRRQSRGRARIFRYL